jgi:chromosome segregation ATPase
MNFLKPCLFILFTSLLACSQESASSSADTAYAKPQEATASGDAYALAEQEESASSPADPLPDAQERVLIRSAESKMEVQDLNQHMKTVEGLVGQQEGYLGNINWQHYDYQDEVAVTIHIPADRFQDLLDTLQKLALAVDYLRISTEDVTEEYVDIETRLKTKKAVRDRYEEILRTQAKTVEEVLLAEEQIRRLQEEIEAREGRLRYLSQRAAMSTIQLELYQPKEATVRGSWLGNFWSDIKHSLSFGGTLTKDILLGLLSIWPLLLLAGILFWRRKAISRFFKR